MSEPSEGVASIDLVRSVAVYRQLLVEHRDSLNAMNVFPVADADTGTNMLHTVDAVLEAALVADGAATGPDGFANAVRTGALEGRGNSGLLLGQYLTGFTADSHDLPSCLTEAAAHARRAVQRPVDGTMLSVADAAAGAVGNTNLELIFSARSLAAAALTRTPSQLAVLRDAGVLDSGGAGLTLFFDALWLVATGLAAPDDHVGQPQSEGQQSAHAEAVTGYEVQFTTTGADRAQLMDLLASLGDSVSVGGSSELVAHLHVEHPGSTVVALAEHLGGVPSTLRIESLVGAPTR